MIWASMALAGRLTLIGPGRIERPLEHLDADVPFEQADEKTVEGEGWFRIRSLGVPYFVFLGPDTETAVDLRARKVTGSEEVGWQLEGQWQADLLRPADLKQAKKATKQLAKAMKSAPQQARELALGRLAMVLAERQKPEIGGDEGWLAEAHATLAWSDATARTPTFVDFALEVGAALREDLELDAGEERLKTAAVPGQESLRYGLMAASIACCVHGAETDAAVRAQVGDWPVLTARLDALLPKSGSEPPPIVGTSFDDTTGELALAEQGRVVVAFWEVDQGLPTVVTDLIELRSERPDLGVVVVGHGEDQADWRSKVREHVGDGVIHVLSGDAHDRWYVSESPRFFLLVDGAIDAADRSRPSDLGL